MAGLDVSKRKATSISVGGSLVLFSPLALPIGATEINNKNKIIIDTVDSFIEASNKVMV